MTRGPQRSDPLRPRPRPADVPHVTQVDEQGTTKPVIISTRRSSDSPLGASRAALLDEFSPPPPPRPSHTIVARLTLLISAVGLSCAALVVAAMFMMLIAVDQLR